MHTCLNLINIQSIMLFMDESLERMGVREQRPAAPRSRVQGAIPLVAVELGNFLFGLYYFIKNAS